MRSFEVKDHMFISTIYGSITKISLEYIITSTLYLVHLLLHDSFVKLLQGLVYKGFAECDA